MVFDPNMTIEEFFSKYDEFDSKFKKRIKKELELSENEKRLVKGHISESVNLPFKNLKQMLEEIE